MPELLTFLGYKVYFWLNESKPLEPIHVHVSKFPHQNSTKIWVKSDGHVELANNNDKIPNKDMKRLLKLLSSSVVQDELKIMWKNKFHKITYIDNENVR